MAKLTKDKLVSNVAWEFGEKFGAQFIKFVLSLILARVLAPENYGVVSLTTTFIHLLSIFVDCGLASALIQKRDADDLDFSTVFFSNLLFCLIMYGILFLAAPLIAVFYENELLKPVIRATALMLIFAGIKNVQRAYISKHLLFKKFFFASLLGTVLAAVVSYWMALHGYGTWALVALHLVDTAVDTAVIWMTVGWKPKLMFSFERLKSLSRYGIKILFAAFVGSVYADFLALAIGKVYTADYLSIYAKGRKFPQIVSVNLLGAINSVLFPAMSSINDDIEALKKLVKESIALSNYIMWPLMAGLFVMAENVIVLLITDTWLPCVPFLQIFAVFYAFSPFTGGNINALKAIGRSDLTFKIELWKDGLSLAIFIGSLFFGTKGLAISFLVCIPVILITETRYSMQFFDYPLLQQLKDNLIYAVMGIAMAVPVWFVGTLKMRLLYKVVLQIVTGAAAYILESVVLGVEPFYFLLDYLKKAIGRKPKSEEI